MAVVRLTVVSNEIEAEVVCGILRRNGIVSSYRATDRAAAGKEGVGMGGPAADLLQRTVTPHSGWGANPPPSGLDDNRERRTHLATGRKEIATSPRDASARLARMAEAAEPLEQQLEEIGTQLAWVRDYL